MTGMEQGGSRILVIDDDDLMRDLLSTLLEVRGYRVTVAPSGESALDMLRGNDLPDAILTDMQMPGLESEALTAALRAAVPDHVVVLGMSGSRPSPGALEYLDAFLSKPFDIRLFEETLAAARTARVTRSGPADKMAATARDEQGSTVPVLDQGIFEALAKSFRPDQMRELYNLTLDDVRKRLTRMHEHAAADDLPAVQREAHAIKGSCGMVGARELQALATAAEGGTTVHTSALADFPLACDRLRRMLDEKLHKS